MIPPSLTAITFHQVDLGSQLGIRAPKIIGAATLTSQIGHRHVTFELEAIVLQPSDPDTLLFRWLNEKLADDRCSVAGYALQDSCSTLSRSTLSNWSPGFRILSGQTRRSLVDMNVHDKSGAPRPFAVAAQHRGFPAAGIEPGVISSSWICGKTAATRHKLEVDAVSTWRLAMHGITECGLMSRAMHQRLESKLAGWLASQPSPATRLHLENIHAAESRRAGKAARPQGAVNDDRS